jgi:hypothetical protein
MEGHGWPIIKGALIDRVYEAIKEIKTHLQIDVPARESSPLMFLDGG